MDDSLPPKIKPADFHRLSSHSGNGYISPFSVGIAGRSRRRSCRGSSDFSHLHQRRQTHGFLDFSDLISDCSRSCSSLSSSSSSSSSDEELHGISRSSSGAHCRADEMVTSSDPKKAKEKEVGRGGGEERRERKTKASKAAKWVLSGVSSAFFSSLHACSCLKLQTREDLDMDASLVSMPSSETSSPSPCPSSDASSPPVSNKPKLQTRKRGRSNILHALKRLKLR